jgi:small-conductance mechanosensitive channel
VLAPDGSVVRELQGPDRKGIQRVNWDLRYPLTFKPTAADEGWFGPPKGTFVLPGQYTVKLAARGRELTQTVQVQVDPRAQTSREALEARFKASQAAAELQRAFTESAAVVQAMTTELDAVNARMKEPGAKKADVEAPVKEFTKRLDDLKEKFKAGWGGPKFLIFDLAGQLQASTSAPTEAQLRAIDQLTTRLTADIGTLNAVTSKDLPELRTRLAAAGLATAEVKAVTPPKR